MTHRWPPLNGRKLTIIVYCQPVNTGTVKRCIFQKFVWLTYARLVKILVGEPLVQACKNCLKNRAKK